ncbi:hypothetical protein [Tardiphaga sp. 709]|uniref:hypothetical protein n=1 Tax=Tardiphaga sp. 709 TaxID=3076039 RepID=UPI0028E653DB|nr:hypothetical protein [Tardiphaga sp. 709]WNV09588.1 hypothetical protein RSO67_29770 [Tardiphaga sp. 709]
MRDIDIINKAVEDAQSVLRDFIRPGPRDPQDTLVSMLEILDHRDVVAAQERLRKGYGHLRLVK